MAKLSLKHIYKIYSNGTKAVNDFNIEIGDDEFIVFVGPSGCGKSTTLRMIAGLEDITAGDFYIDGVLVNALEPKDRDMAMVFQNYALYPHMTVYENMAFGLRIRNVPKNEIDKRVQEAARILDIADQLQKKPKEMSGGQRQRVALGRAMVRKPKVFLLDEPLSNLDAKLRSSMRAEITKLHKALNTTFIYVTHDQVEAMTMGTRIVVMKKGVIQQIDTPMNLYDYPSNEFVAGFIGTPQMNFLEAKLSYVTSKNNERMVQFDFGGNKLTCLPSELRKIDVKHIYTVQDIRVGIRPEHVLLAEKGDKNAIAAEVEVVEALGNDANLIVSTNDKKMKLTIKVVRNDSIMVGDTIYFTFNFNKLHLFSKETTNTILPRVPEMMTIKGRVEGDTIKTFGGSIKLTQELVYKLKGHKDIYLNVPRRALIPGKDIVAEITSKEEINKKWLNGFEYEGEYLYSLTDEYISGSKTSFSIKIADVDFFDDKFNLIIPRLVLLNEIPGCLSPVHRIVPVANKAIVANKSAIDTSKTRIKEKEMKLFNYHFLGREYTPDLLSTSKIYSLLGKRFEAHQITFSIDAKDIFFIQSDDGFKGIVKEIINYGDRYYYRMKCGDVEIIVDSDENDCHVGDTLTMDVRVPDIGVTDVNFQVKLI